MTRDSGSGGMGAGGLPALAAVAAGAALGIVAERLWSRSRLVEQPVPSDPQIAHGTAITRVVADDGAVLHARIDTPVDWHPGDPTVVLVHGFALDLTTWDHQRRALLGVARVVSYDHRGHARSAQAHRAGTGLTIDRLGQDLATVIEDCTDDESVIVIGHSMGGMTIMALAEQRPDWFGERIIGVGLLATSAGEIGTVTLGLPRPLAQLAHRLTPIVGTVVDREWLTNLVLRIRDSGSDLSRVLTRTYAFGESAPEHGTALVAHLLATTPLPVVADLLGDIGRHDRRDALGPLSRIPTLIIVGDADQLTPASHSRRLHQAIDDSTLIELDGVGHMLTLEAPDAVDSALVAFVSDIARFRHHDERRPAQ